MDIDNKKVELFEVFVKEIKEELIDLSAHQIDALELAFHAGFEKGFNLGYTIREEDEKDVSDARDEIPF